MRSSRDSGDCPGRARRRPARTLLTVTPLILVGIVGQPASSALLEVDLETAGDGLVTRDTEKGLEWLDLTETVNMSYDDADANLAALGFRVATRAEVEGLFASAGFGTTGEFVVEDFAPATALLALVGKTQGPDLLPPRLFPGAAGLREYDASSARISSFRLCEEPCTFFEDPLELGRGQATLDGGIVAKNEQDPERGVWMVRPAPAFPVPSASAGTLAVLAGLMMISARHALRHRRLLPPRGDP